MSELALPYAILKPAYEFKEHDPPRRTKSEIYAYR